MEQTTEQPIRVLVVGAHPDDPEFACGGTVAVWVSEGKEVHYLVCTQGDKGSEDPAMTSEKLMAIRVAEQRAAAAVLGVKSVTFLSCRDAELSPNLELRKHIVRAIRQIRPHAVVTHDPATIYGENFINHPDHRAVGTATLDAIFPTARDRLNFPEHEREGLLAHKVKEVYLWGSQNPNFWVDVSPVFEKKVEAILQHRSQVRAPEELRERMRERLRTVGAARGLEMAEAFHRIVMAR